MKVWVPTENLHFAIQSSKITNPLAHPSTQWLFFQRLSDARDAVAASNQIELQAQEPGPGNVGNVVQRGATSARALWIASLSRTSWGTFYRGICIGYVDPMGNKMGIVDIKWPLRTLHSPSFATLPRFPVSSGVVPFRFFGGLSMKTRDVMNNQHHLTWWV